MTTSRPLRPGLFRQTSGGPTLLAGRCTACGHIEFPRADRCPQCRADAQKEIDAGDRAELLCATTVEIPSGRLAAGYTVGYVILSCGVRIFSQLASDAAVMAAGSSMRLEIVPLWQEGDDQVLSYRFRPEGGAD